MKSLLRRKASFLDKPTPLSKKKKGLLEEEEDGRSPGAPVLNRTIFHPNVVVQLM